jgi:hypothetical protein
MDISIFGYKLNLEVLILIGVIYLILVGHTFCGCCNYGLMEGLENNSNVLLSKSNESLGGAKMDKNTETSIPEPVDTKTVEKNTKKSSKSVEGFVGANTNYGESSVFNLTNNIPINTNSWNQPNMTVVPGQPLDSAVKNFLSRPKQPIPLPEGEMLMFADTPFKPECCPNTFSNSMGCACMTSDQYNYLILRGGNNVPYSEY